MRYITLPITAGKYDVLFDKKIGALVYYNEEQDTVYEIGKLELDVEEICQKNMEVIAERDLNLLQK